MNKYILSLIAGFVLLGGTGVMSSVQASSTAGNTGAPSTEDQSSIPCNLWDSSGTLSNFGHTILNTVAFLQCVGTTTGDGHWHMFTKANTGSYCSGYKFGHTDNFASTISPTGVAHLYCAR
jgi:hypothetical protein